MNILYAILAYIGSFFTSDQGQSIVRGIVKWIGGLLVAKGWFDASMIDAVLGVIGTLAGFVQSGAFHATGSTPDTAQS